MSNLPSALSIFRTFHLLCCSMGRVLWRFMTSTCVSLSLWLLLFFVLCDCVSEQAFLHGITGVLIREAVQKLYSTFSVMLQSRWIELTIVFMTYDRRYMAFCHSIR